MRAVAALVVIGLCIGVYWFAPWTLFTHTTIADAAPPGASVLAQGEFVSHEHPTTGTVKLLQLPDGSRVVRLEGLHTSEGPKVDVLLSDVGVPTNTDHVDVFEDGRFTDLGPLKGNLGDANYRVPHDFPVDGGRSVSVWCDRFAVSFGAAPLTPNNLNDSTPS